MHGVGVAQDGRHGAHPLRCHPGHDPRRHFIAHLNAGWGRHGFRDAGRCLGWFHVLVQVRLFGRVALEAAPVVPSDGGPGAQGLVRREHLEAKGNAVKDAAIAAAAVGLDHLAGDAVRRFLKQRLEEFPNVAFDADGEVRLRLAEGEHALDGGVRAEDWHMEERDRMRQAVRQGLRPGAFGEQEVLPVGDRVGAAGELVANQGADVFGAGRVWHGVVASRRLGWRRFYIVVPFWNSCRPKGSCNADEELF